MATGCSLPLYRWPRAALRRPTLRAVLSVAALLGVALVPAGCEAVDQAPAPVGQPPATVEPARFHHVRLNVTDPQATIDYYEKFFGALPIIYGDRSPGLFAERSFILLDPVPEPPPSNLGTTIWHIGWAGVVGSTEFEWRTREGIGVQTPITPLGAENHYMYFWGPDREVVEVWTGSRNHRFEHVHLIASDVHATMEWFEEHLGVRPTTPSEPGVRGRTIRVDNVNIIVWVNPAGGPNPHPADLPPEIQPEVGVTEGTAINHIAFSYSEIRPVFDRMSAAGAEIVRGIGYDERHGITSFFVRGPDGLLVEIVESPPVPEGLWR